MNKWLFIGIIFMTGCHKLPLQVNAQNESQHITYIVAGQSNADSPGPIAVYSHTGMVDVTDIWSRQQFIPSPSKPTKDYVAWVYLGDMLAQKTGKTISFIGASQGGTNSNQWVENYDDLFSRLLALTEQYQPDAILWVQGEADSIPDPSTINSYENLKKLILMTKAKSKNTIWYVALDAGNVPNLAGSGARQAQERVISEGLALQGPDIDKIRSDDSNRDVPVTGLHLSDKGLHAHAAAWFSILTHIFIIRELDAKLDSPKTVNRLCRGALPSQMQIPSMPSEIA